MQGKLLERLGLRRYPAWPADARRSSFYVAASVDQTLCAVNMGTLFKSHSNSKAKSMETIIPAG